MNENDTPRPDGNWKNVIPPGFRPIQFPQVIDLDKEDSSDDEPMIVAQGDLRLTAEALGSMELLATILDKDRAGGSPLARQIADMARFWKGHVRLIGGMAAVVALALVGAVLPIGGTASAQAMEAPQPDPSGSAAPAPMYPVVLDRLIKVVPVPVVSTMRGPSGLYCSSVVRLGQPLGRSWSSVPWFTVTAWLDARVTPLGRVVAYVVDDATGASVPIVLDVRRPSRFSTGTWLDLGQGDEFVSAPLYAYTATVGAWTPQRYSPVQVQELTRRGWRTRATLTTTAAGVASGTVHLGGGVHLVRVVRPAGQTVWSTAGSTRRVVVTTEPLDMV